MNEASLRAHAFTLVEVLVSMVVLLLLVVFVTSIVNAVNRSWGAGEQRVEIYQNGRAILDQMARDLSPALVSGSLQTVQNFTLTAQLAGSNTTQITNSDNLFWQTPGTANTFGNVCEVGYLIVSTTNATPAHYRLQRFFSAPNTRYTPPVQTLNPATRTFQIYDTAFSATTAPWLANMTAANFQSCVATLSEGVLGLWVRFLDRNGDPVPWLKDAATYSSASPMKFNSAAAFNGAIPGTSNSFQYTALTTTVAANRLPTSAELSIVTLDQKSLQRPGITVPALPSSSSPANVPTDIDTYLNTLIAQKLGGAQVFTRTVTLRNGTD